MTRKQVLIFLSFLQAALIGLLFIPVASYTAGSGSTVGLTAIDLAHRYADAGHTIDSGVYLFFALCCPIVSLPALFLLHKKRTAIGLTACLSAMNLLVHACFYTAAESSMTASVTMSGRYLYLVILSLFSLLLSIYAYLGVTMDAEDGGEDKK